MTKTLTEQWREGTLKTGSYYIRTITGNEKSDYFEGKKFCFWTDYEVEEILTPVPSYSEYQALKDNCELTHTRLKGTHQKIAQLEKKLSIAMEALDAVSGDYNEAENLGYYFRKIEEVK